MSALTENVYNHLAEPVVNSLGVVKNFVLYSGVLCLCNRTRTCGIELAQFHLQHM